MPITCLEDQLRRDEGVRLSPYKDSVGKLTIGVGRNLSDVGIGPDESDLMLSNDIKRATVSLESSFPWTMVLDDVRKGALLNMAFNMGVRGLSGFHDFLDKMQAGDFTGAALAMLDSLWAKQVGPRALRLSQQIQTGVWQ
jgi:lysozyme